MKYYSEILNKNFDTVKELEEAEGKEKFKLAAKAKAEERKKTLIEKAKADYEEAVDKYNAAVIVILIAILVLVCFICLR